MTRLTLIAAKNDHIAAMDRELAPLRKALVVTHATGGFEALLEALAAGDNDIIVADAGRIGKTAQMQLESAVIARPRVSLILLSSDHSPEFLVWAMRIGVAQVLLVPAQRGELQMAIERQLHRRQAVANLIGGNGRDAGGKDLRAGSVTAFLPCKGGSGATFLATSAAMMLAERGKRVALLDLNLHFGDAALYLSDSAQAPTVTEIARDIERIDADFIESGLLQVRSNLWLLAAPESAESALDIQPEAIERIIDAARSRFDIVIVDCGRVMDSCSLRALDAADTIFMVLQMTLAHVHDAKRLKRVFDELGYSKDKLRVLVNRFEAGTDISTRDLKRALATDVDLRIPNDFVSVAYAINHAMPVFEHKPDCAVSTAISTLADRIDPTSTQSSKPAASLAGRLGSLTSLFASAKG